MDYKNEINATQRLINIYKELKDLYPIEIFTRPNSSHINLRIKVKDNQMISLGVYGPEDFYFCEVYIFQTEECEYMGSLDELKERIQSLM